MSQPAVVTLTAAGTSAAIALSPLVPGRAYGVSVTNTAGTAVVQSTVDDQNYVTTSIWGTVYVPSNLQSITSTSGDYNVVTGALGALRMIHVGAGTSSLRVYQDGLASS